MRVPQVRERIKEAPAQALRGVFAGIGQLLLITDKLRNKTPASQQVPRARAPEPSEKSAAASAATPVASPVSAAPVAPAEAAPAEAAPAEAAAAEAAAAAEGVTEARDLDKTGNVRLLTGKEAAASAAAAKVDADAPVAADAPAAADAPVAEAAVAAADAGPSAPWPNYDELSIASLRARLRNLDVAQLRQLVEYETAHADRADVIAMFERRIAKLQAETTPEERGEAEGQAVIEAQEDAEAEVQDEVEAEAEGET